MHMEGERLHQECINKDSFFYACDLDYIQLSLTSIVGTLVNIPRSKSNKGCIISCMSERIYE